MRSTYKGAARRIVFAQWPTALVLLSMLAGAPDVRAACPADQPIKLILTTTPGGIADVVGRALTQQLATQLPNPAIVEYRPGAGGAIGGFAVATAKPDGCTIGLLTNQYVMLSLLRTDLKFDPVADIAPIAYLGSVPYVWLTRQDTPYKSLSELLDYARQHPGKVTFASGGTGSVSHLLPLSFRKKGIDFYNVPFGGQAQALNAILGGQVDILIEPIGTGSAHVKSGKLRALATTGLQRSRSLPDVPTLSELGIPQRAVTLFAIMTPAAVQPAVASKLNADINAALAAPAVKVALDTQEFTIETGPVSKAATIITQERTFWGEVIRDNQVKGD